MLIPTQGFMLAHSGTQLDVSDEVVKGRVCLIGSLSRSFLAESRISRRSRLALRELDVHFMQELTSNMKGLIFSY